MIRAALALTFVCAILLVGFFMHDEPDIVGAVPQLPAQAHTIAGERVEMRQRGNVVEVVAPWKGERGITLKKDLGTPSQSELSRGKRNIEVITEVLDDGFKVDFLLNEKPNTNVFCQTVEGHENYDWFYQPALTPEEVADGASRPENVVGSYAVYHKTLKNHKLGETNYATGKAFHIYRPQVWEVNDKENTTEWAELSFNNGQLCVTVDQNYLDTATYPVRVDPTFGYLSVGASSGTLADSTSDRSYTVGTSDNLSEAGTLDSLHVALDSSDNDTETVDITAALYREDSAGSGSHGLVVGIERANLSVDGTAQFYTFTASSESLSADDYILAAIGNGEDITDGAVVLMYDTTSSRNLYSESTTGAGSYSTRVAEDPWTETATVTSLQRSIYATYTATASETATTPATNFTGSSVIESVIIQ